MKTNFKDFKEGAIYYASANFKNEPEQNWIAVCECISVDGNRLTFKDIKILKHPDERKIKYGEWQTTYYYSSEVTYTEYSEEEYPEYYI